MSILAAVAPIRLASFEPSVSPPRSHFYPSLAPVQRNVAAPGPTPPHPATVVPSYSYSVLKNDGKPERTQSGVIDLTACGSQYRIALRHGLLCTDSGEPFDTGGHRAKFVMQADGSLFASVKFRDDAGKTLHHSSFTRQPVAAAGLMMVDRGRVRFCICESGHYEPTPEMMAQFLRRMAGAGVAIGGLPVGFHLSDSKEDAHLVWYDGTYAATVRAQHTREMDPVRQTAAPAGLSPARSL